MRLALGTGAPDLDLYGGGGPAGGGLVAPQFACHLVDDPGAVTGRVTGVVLGVVGMADDARPLGRARVQVADPLVVGEE